LRVERRGAANVLGPGDFFGDAGFLTVDDRERDAIADGVVTFDFLRPNEFLAVLSLNLSVAAPLIFGRARSGR